MCFTMPNVASFICRPEEDAGWILFS